MKGLWLNISGFKIKGQEVRPERLLGVKTKDYVFQQARP
jgi:hypothetical protein